MTLAELIRELRVSQKELRPTDGYSQVMLADGKPVERVTLEVGDAGPKVVIR